MRLPSFLEVAMVCFLVRDTSICPPAHTHLSLQSHRWFGGRNATAVIRSRTFGVLWTTKRHMSRIRLTPVPIVDGSEQRKY
ncbi:hypothetical protein BKA82DRAFT_4221898 [Pisolithus tinctorius]|nr:hypothetical protein BKA82DRAFT_4221898 [Pisolithus tinctorius]